MWETYGKPHISGFLELHRIDLQVLYVEDMLCVASPELFVLITGVQSAPDVTSEACPFADSLDYNGLTTVNPILEPSYHCDCWKLYAWVRWWYVYWVHILTYIATYLHDRDHVPPVAHTIEIYIATLIDWDSLSCMWAQVSFKLCTIIQCKSYG